MSMNNVNGYNTNNYCACTGGTPEYVIKLNQQGPPGPQGEQGLQGPQGVSPEISVYQDTDDTYILQVITATSSFMTPNLMTNANNQINALDQKLQAEIDTKANLTLDNINVANPFTLNGLQIFQQSTSTRITNENKPLIVGNGQQDNTFTGENVSIGEDNVTGTIYLKASTSTLYLGSGGITYNNEQLATQPWVEEQLDGFLTDLPAATTTTLGAVKVYNTVDTVDENFPILLGSNSADTNSYQKLFLDSTLLNGEALVTDTSASGITRRRINKVYLTLKDNSLAYCQETINQGFDLLANTWRTTGRIATTSPITATTSRAGFVKPDGTTITITDDGTISAVGGGGGTTNIINDDVPSDTTTYSSNKIDELNGQQNGQITQLVDTVTKLQESVTALRNRVAALEANINGGNA